MSSGGETPEELEFFVNEFQLSYPVLADADQTYWHYQQAGGSSPYPLDYIIDQEGRVSYFNTEYDPDRMTQIIDGLLGISPDIRVEPESLDFGPVALGESAWTLLTVFNDGAGSLHIDGIASSELEFLPNLESMVIDPGSSQALLVEFTPSGLGPKTGDLTLNSDDADESTVTLSLYGEGVEATGADFPLERFELHQNEPNPFRGDTAIRFSLDRGEKVRLELFDVRGRLVRLLESGDELRGEGDHQVIWDGRDNRGRPLPSGVYFYKLNAGGKQRARKAILMR